MPLHKSFPHGLLRMISVIRIGGIKITEALFQKCIKQCIYFLKIKGILLICFQQGQPHTAKTKIHPVIFLRHE